LFEPQMMIMIYFKAESKTSCIGSALRALHLEFGWVGTRVEIMDCILLLPKKCGELAAVVSQEQMNHAITHVYMKYVFSFWKSYSYHINFSLPDFWFSRFTFDCQILMELGSQYVLCKITTISQTRNLSHLKNKQTNK